MTNDPAAALDRAHIAVGGHIIAANVPGDSTLAALRADGYEVVPVGEVERLRAVAEEARLVSQWHNSIGSGPIEELDAELRDLGILARAALAAPATEDAK